MSEILVQPWSDKGKWNDFVRQSPEGSIFCDLGFLESLNLPIKLYQVFEKNKIVACFPIILEKDSSKPIQAPHFFGMYQGVMFSNEFEGLSSHSKAKRQMAILDKIILFLSEQYDRISFCLHPLINDVRSFQWFNYHEPHKGQFRIQIRYTGILDLNQFSDFDEYLSSIRQTRRNIYRKNLKNGLKLTEGRVSDVKNFSEMRIKTFQRQNINESSEVLKVFENSIESMVIDGGGELYFCKSSRDELISGSLFACHRDTAYYLQAASNPEYRSLEGGTFIVLENIKKCFAKGVRFVDFVGINSPSRGDFKTSFNAKPVPYFVVHWEKPI